MQSQRLCQNTWAQLRGWNRAMLRRLSGAGPPDTIKLVELHEIPGSQGISLIKAILKNDFTTIQLLHFNNYVPQWQSHWPTADDNGLQINGKSHHKDASGTVTSCLTKISYQSDSFGGCFPTFHITSSTWRFPIYLLCLLLCHEMFSCFMFRDHCVSSSISLGYRKQDVCLDPQ